VHDDRVSRVATVVFALLWIGACSSPSPSASHAATTVSGFGRPGCHPASPVANGEVHGSASPGISLWGLTGGQPISVGAQIKIVWRMSGVGPLAITPVAPDGRARSLSWGPAYHLSSSYHRPGQEWGAGFVFDQPGCWHIELSRTIGRGDVYLQVPATA
jgi:hypothetical protein